MEQPEVRYARTVDGVNIAYQVHGDGPVDLVYTLGIPVARTLSYLVAWVATIMLILRSLGAL